MSEHVTLSRNQERFLQELLLGKTIVDAAKAVGITDRTGHRWLKDPAFQAERTQREASLREAEQAEIERILTSGYAAMHERVKALDRVAREIEASYHDTKTGEIIFPWMTPDKLREWRGCLDDIARELGHRIKKQEIEHSGLLAILNAEHESLINDLEALPDVTPGQSAEPNTGTAANSA